MLRFLADYSLSYGPLRVFDSITFRAVLAIFLAFVFCLAFAPVFIRFMRKRMFTENMEKSQAQLQKIHASKKGTPTMGGIVMVGGVLIAVLLVGDVASVKFWAGMVVLLGYTLLGMIDDYVKWKQIGKGGLSKTQKLVGQFLFAAAGCAILAGTGNIDTHLLLPFTRMAHFYPDLGWLYYVFFVCVIVACSNAVNLTDGLDGLASGCTITVAITFSVLAYVAGNSTLCAHFLVPFVSGSGELSVICAAMIGALMGFLWFNAHPARVFMGDAGSLSFGGILAYVALISKHEIILIVAGGIFVAEAVSVMLQIVSFRFFGKRIFKCAPLHHHLELSGWSENHVVVRLWMVGAVLAAIGLGSLKMH